MDSITIDIQGLDGLDKALNQIADVLGDKSAATVFKDALREGAKIYEDDMKAHVPIAKTPKRLGKNKVRRTGTLIDSILIRAQSNRNLLKNKDEKAAAVISVGPHKKQGFVALFIEKGTKPHDLNRGSKKSRNQIGYKKRSLRAKHKVNKNKKHPGSKPTPFISRSFVRKTPQVISTVSAALAKKLATAQKRIAKMNGQGNKK